MSTSNRLQDTEWLAKLIEGPDDPGRDVPSYANPLISAVFLGANPKTGLSNLYRLIQHPEGAFNWPSDETHCKRFASVLASGPSLSRIILHDMDLVRSLSPNVRRLIRDPADLLRQLRRAICEAKAQTHPDRAASVITQFRNARYLELASCEFDADPLEIVCAQYSDLADACLHAAMEVSVSSVEQHFGIEPLSETCRHRSLCAIAMGKYGAQELNFCSDIDIVFIYKHQARSDDPENLQAFYARACRMVVAMLSEPNAFGFSFRVDLRLRPEGSLGPICHSLASAEHYFETSGGPYDRLAWLKARPAAGDSSIGKTLTHFLNPFVFPRSLSTEIVKQTKALSKRIRQEIVDSTNRLPGWNVKLSSGGIRDIEFFCQTLQLLHGGKQKILQEPKTLRALERLFACGLVNENERLRLTEAYIFLRRVEHRLQLHDGRQTHLLPDTGTIRAHAISHLGFSEQSFNDELRHHRDNVIQIYSTLGKPAALAREAMGRPSAESPPHYIQQYLGQFGLADTQRAAELFAPILARPWGPFGRKASSTLVALGDLLLTELRSCADPDAAFSLLMKFSHRYSGYRGLWHILYDNQQLLRLLLSIFGSSEFLATLVIAHPQLLDDLLSSSSATTYKDSPQITRELDALFQLHGTNEHRYSIFERFRSSEFLRIGLNDVAGTITQERVWVQLTNLAELILRTIFDQIWQECASRYGVPRDNHGEAAAMTIMGLGKVGAREMNYASDLDLIFIFDSIGFTDGSKQITNREFFSRFAQRLIRSITSPIAHGSLYHIDSRLRPSGHQGTLVCSFDGFRRHHMSAALWERQALIKARPVAGNTTLGDSISSWIEHYVYETHIDNRTLRHEMQLLKRRIEREHAQHTERYHYVKFGAGGLIELEFLVQYLQLTLGHSQVDLRRGNTLEALDYLTKLEKLGPTIQPLRKSYLFFRRIESALQLIRGRGAERFSRDKNQTTQLARRLGYRKEGLADENRRFLIDYEQHTRTVRALFDKMNRGELDF